MFLFSITYHIYKVHWICSYFCYEYIFSYCLLHKHYKTNKILHEFIIISLLNEVFTYSFSPPILINIHNIFTMIVTDANMTVCILLSCPQHIQYFPCDQSAYIYLIIGYIMFYQVDTSTYLTLSL